MGGSISKKDMQDYKTVIKGRYDEKEIEQMYKLFHKHAPQGKMDKGAFKRYVDELKIFKNVDVNESYAQLFRGYDIDKDGTITFKEYLQYHLGIEFSSEQLYDIVFSMFDADGNGCLTRSELVEVVTNSTRWNGLDVDAPQVQKAIDEEINHIVSLIDFDKDGKISKEELYSAAQKHPEILERLKSLA